MFPSGESGTAPGPPDRDNENTKTYALAALRAATSCGVPAIDFWSELQKALPGDAWKETLYDGLHIGPDAAAVLYDLLVACIAE